MASAPHALERHLDLIESALRAALPNDGSELARAAHYVMGWEDGEGLPTAAGGKRVRPALALFAAEAVGGDHGDAIPAAVAVELVHNFSLVHDEVQDRDHERHHRPTTWALHGEAQAINVGDYLFTAAIQALVAGPGDQGRRLAALGALNAAIASMIAGQWADISFESRTEVGVDDYLRMVEGKTGALLGAPLQMGALLAGADPALARSLGDWGRAVGLAFQVWDDYLGTWGDPAATGKPAGSDILRRKKSYPIVYGLGQPAARAAIVEVYSGEEVTREGVAAVVEALESDGAREECISAAGHLSDEADRALVGLPLPASVVAEMRAIAGYMGNRPA